VAIVVAEGEIGDGQAPAGRIGGESTSNLIRKARENEKVKALVLRVNSPGGSAFASEQIRRELELTRTAGKPVVVSMGDVAASGGYWIAMASDEVIAEPATITGSIGVFGMLPTAQGLMDKAGVRTGGYRTTWLVGAYDFRRDLDPRFAQLVQASIGHIYSDFTTKAAAARSTTKEAIDAVAQGRIWTGEQARGHGLIDRTGTLADAMKAARERAKLPEDAAVRYVEKSPGPWVELLKGLGLEAHAIQRWAALLQFVGLAMGEVEPDVPPLGMGAAYWLPKTDVGADLWWLGDVVNARRPFSAVVHCFCGSER
jgi:protease-4